MSSCLHLSYKPYGPFITFSYIFSPTISFGIKRMRCLTDTNYNICWLKGAGFQCGAMSMNAGVVRCQTESISCDVFQLPKEIMLCKLQKASAISFCCNCRSRHCASIMSEPRRQAPCPHRVYNLDSSRFGTGLEGSLSAWETEKCIRLWCTVGDKSESFFPQRWLGRGEVLPCCRAGLDWMAGWRQLFDE